MNAPAQKRTEWLSPSFLLTALGMLGMISTSYNFFQTSTAVELAVQRGKVEMLEYRVSQLEAAKVEHAAQGDAGRAR